MSAAVILSRSEESQDTNNRNQVLPLSHRQHGRLRNAAHPLILRFFALLLMNLLYGSQIETEGSSLFYEGVNEALSIALFVIGDAEVEVFFFVFEHRVENQGKFACSGLDGSRASEARLNSAEEGSECALGSFQRLSSKPEGLGGAVRADHGRSFFKRLPACGAIVRT